MKVIINVFKLLLATICITNIQAQDAGELIGKVKKAQGNIRNIYYKAYRQDTLVTGMVRSMSGEVKLSTLPEDPIFGFRFWAKRDGMNMEAIYDGTAAFFIDHNN